MSGNISNAPPTLANLNPNYAITISGTDEQGSRVFIVGSAPEEFSIDVNSEWSPLLGPMAEQLLGKLGSVAESITRTAQLFGYPAFTTFMTQQIWTSTSPIELKIPLRLNQVYDARQEVTIPALQLLSLVLPSTTAGGTLLYAPGPNFGSSTYKISISIGRVLRFSNVIITGVNAVFSTLPTKQGDFIACDLDIAARTSTILTKGDLLNIFRNVMPADNGQAIPTPNVNPGTAVQQNLPVPPAAPGAVPALGGSSLDTLIPGL